MTKNNGSTKAVEALATVPFSEESEQAVLGSILLAPECFVEVAAILQNSADFFLIRHQVIYSAMCALIAANRVLEPIGLAEYLEASGDLADIGGRAYLIELSNATPTHTHVSVYAEMVARAALRRRMLVALDTMRASVFDETIALDEVISHCDNEWLNATAQHSEKTRGEWIERVASDLYDEMEAALVRKEMRGLSTGLRDVDQILNGLDREQLIILAGSTGMGKSSAMDHIALHLAQQNIPVFYATSERSKLQVTRRMASILSGINSQQVTSGKLSTDQAKRYTYTIAQLSHLPIYFDDNPQPRPRDIHAQADWMIKRHGCQIILFDGMYRSRTGIDKIDNGGNGHVKYGRIALDLKTISRTLQVPVLVSHQLNRNVANRQDKHPRIDDLRESGDIEQEADKIILLYRDEYYNPKTDTPHICEWIVAKHRDGATGTARTYFEAETTRFLNINTETMRLDD